MLTLVASSSTIVVSVHGTWPEILDTCSYVLETHLVIEVQIFLAALNRDHLPYAASTQSNIARCHTKGESHSGLSSALLRGCSMTNKKPAPELLDTDNWTLSSALQGNSY